MLTESTTDGVSIHESFLRVSSWSVRGLSFASLDVRAVAFDGLGERESLRESDRGTLGPEVVGGWSAWALGSGGGVGFELGEGDVVGGPISGMTVALGVTFGSRFQRADACFDGPIVPWRMGWREQAKDVSGFEKGSSLFGNEGRTVIAFQDEGSAVDGEEAGESADGDVGGHVGDGGPEELLVAGEVADGEDNDLPVHVTVETLCSADNRRASERPKVRGESAGRGYFAKRRGMSNGRVIGVRQEPDGERTYKRVACRTQDVDAGDKTRSTCLADQMARRLGGATEKLRQKIVSAPSAILAAPGGRIVAVIRGVRRSRGLASEPLGSLILRTGDDVLGPLAQLIDVDVDGSRRQGVEAGRCQRWLSIMKKRANSKQASRSGFLLPGLRGLKFAKNAVWTSARANCQGFAVCK